MSRCSVIQLTAAVAVVTAMTAMLATAQQAPARGGSAGMIELGPDDKPAFPDPPAGFNLKRDNVPHGELTVVQYDSESPGTRRQIRDAARRLGIRIRNAPPEERREPGASVFLGRHIELTGQILVQHFALIESTKQKDRKTGSIIRDFADQ